MGHPSSPFNPLALAVTLALAMVPTAQAGDILRGGSGAAPTANAPTATTGVATAQAAKAVSNASDSLARTTAALQSVRAMQTAARQVAVAGPNNLGSNPNFTGKILPNVPNGLVIGGLKVAPGVPIILEKPTATENPALWTGAKLPIQTVAGGVTKVTIVQTSSQALLNWETFNIGKRTEVTFNQKAGGNDAGKWIAFNKINDPTGNPTQILGSLDAIGQVYLINQNGILFGGSSQVNSHNLTASTLPINDNLIARGLLNNPDAQFLFSALPLSAGKNGTPAFTPAAPINGRTGDIIVEKGALLSSPTNAAKVGGRVVLIGPNVSNAGEISTPDGQTILAAGEQVGFDAHPSSDPSLRGLDVYVGSVVQTSGEVVLVSGNVSNTGVIDAPRANVTLTGKTIDQSGVINSTTSVSLNGRIDLNANYDAVSNIAYDPTDTLSAGPFLYKSTGLVTLGMGSAIQILPEYASTDKVVGTRLSLPSQINIQGLAVHLEKNAIVAAPSANVAVNAGIWDFIDSASQPLTQFVFAKGQIYLDKGSKIDVAGSADITIPISQNILTLQLRGAELSNSPLQRDGILRGTAINVDLRETGTFNGQNWVGTALGDVSGFAGLIQRSVGELTTAGGTVNLHAGGSVIVQKGSGIDVSGGSFNVEGGMVQTTRVLTNGQLLDISQATPDRVYDSIYTGTSTFTAAKYGLSETYTNPLALTGAYFEEAYQQGANAGALTITAASVALDGNLSGTTVLGSRQFRTEPTTSALPAAAKLTIRFESQQLTPQSVYPVFSPTPPKIIFKTTGEQLAADAFAIGNDGDPLALRKDRLDRVLLSPELLTSGGFSDFTLANVDGDILLPKDTTLATSRAGSIRLSGANINIQGTIQTASGSISLSTFNISPSAAFALSQSPESSIPNANADRGRFVLGVGASLETNGLLTDDRVESSTQYQQLISMAGGNISIDSYSARLEAESRIDVSGGLLVNRAGRIIYGNAGSISIRTGQDATIRSVVGGTLEMKGTLAGFSGSVGGALSLQSETVQIGGIASTAATWLAPDFFSQGGFNQFTITGLGKKTDLPDAFIPAILLSEDTQIAPVAQSLLATADAVNGVTVEQILKPAELRQPVSINFRAPGIINDFNGTLEVRGDIVLETGSVIQTEPSATVSSIGQTVTSLGTILAPGGTITLQGASRFPSLNLSPATAFTTVSIGSKSLLSAAGATVLTANSFGYRTGSVLPGGTISISGNIAAATGAILDVSGASDTLDLSPDSLVFNSGSEVAGPVVPTSSGVTTPLYRPLALRTRVDSDGGSIVLRGAEQLFSDATLVGKSGGIQAVGGSLAISSGIFILADTARTSADINLVVTQVGEIVEPTPVGALVVDAADKTLPQLGHFSVDRFRQGAFADLTLGGNVRFEGPVAIQASGSLTVATGGILMSDDTVNLAASYVTLGQAFAGPLNPQQQLFYFTQTNSQGVTTNYNFLPTNGAGNLKISGDLIDVGVLSLQNIGKARLIAENGSIRGDGSLDIAGDLYLRAGQIYPTTAVTFSLAAYDYQKDGETQTGSIRIDASGSRQLPLSALGRLNVFASDIVQNGVLRAPLGSIQIGWDGNGVAPTGLVTGQPVAVAQTIQLSAGSLTSVSAIDPATGVGLTIPYGLSPDGKSFIDPTGIDITLGNLALKTVNVAGLNINSESGSRIDIGGGGDLYAYRWVSGQGGTRDILASSGSFAVIPGYEDDFAPLAPFNTTGSAAALGSDPGYVNTTLAVGDRVHLAASEGLPAGDYTLLPARYALLPGAVLVTPQSSQTSGTILRPDGSSLVSGYRFNSFNAGAEPMNLATRFEIAPASVVRSRAQYDNFLANGFLRESAAALNLDPPRLPIDSGHLILSANQGLLLDGGVTAQAPAGGRGGLVDINSSLDFEITGRNTKPDPANSGLLTLKSSQLVGFGAESLLIGGVREFGADGTTVTVNTGNITVNNAGSPLTAPEIILVAKSSLTLKPGAVVRQSGNIVGSADRILIGNSEIPASGDGVLLRVSSDPFAQVIRSGLSDSDLPALVIGANSQISGRSLTLDSTAATSLSSTARLNGQTISLNSGQISLALDADGNLPVTSGLVLSGSALGSLEKAQSLSLLSYSYFDIYGAGSIGSSKLSHLAIHAGEIRSFDNPDAIVTFAAQTIQLDNLAGTVLPASNAGVVEAESRLAFNGQTIRLGINQLKISQFGEVGLNASESLIVQGNGGVSTQGRLRLESPVVTGLAGANYSLVADDSLEVDSEKPGFAKSVDGGLGVRLQLTGSAISINSNLLLPSGLLTLHATNGDLEIGSRAGSQIDVGGTAQVFNDRIKYTDAGQINLMSDTGSITIGRAAIVSVAANRAGGDAGSLNVSTTQGNFVVGGKLLGAGGKNGLDGSFSLDVGSLDDLSSLGKALDAGEFLLSRNFRVRTGDVGISDDATVSIYRVSADQGSITVSGSIDASGTNGGSISLVASGSITLNSGSLLTVAGKEFDRAGKGGSISLEVGSSINGLIDPTAMLNIQGGSRLNLAVAETDSDSASLGNFSGKLHLRAPQNVAGTDLRISPILGTIEGASSIAVEGYRLYDVTNANGSTITTVLQGNVRTNATTFAANSASITTRLLGADSVLQPVLVVTPGAEIINRTGALTLAADWDLSTFRFGPRQAPGILTLKSATNIVFNGSLSDGFNPAGAAVGTAANLRLWLAPLMTQNALLPTNTQSWSYRLTAGADFTSADFRNVQTLDSLAPNSGSIQLGRNGGQASITGGANALTRTLIPTLYQVIRTGTGDIDLAAGRDVQLLNQFATIYTAGVQVNQPNAIFAPNDFVTPIVTRTITQGDLGALQQLYPAQFSLAGGNVTVAAQYDLTHLTKNFANVLVADSERQLPNNWLNRRGYVDPLTGQYGASGNNAVFNGINDTAASTAWWIDFSNFFEGIGALGGGNVSLIAGNNISNVDGLIPTNARSPKGTPDAATLQELGGGDLTVRAGNNIDGGVYYVERGTGTLSAGNEITTNETRSPSLGILNGFNTPEIADSRTWLPTTLFVGKSTFNVNASKNILLGPVANPFLLPQGVNNKYYYKTYFSTYTPDSGVEVASLGGNVTLRQSAVRTGGTAIEPLLQIWMDEELRLVRGTAPSASFYQPWLRLNETLVAPFSTVSGLSPANLTATAFSGDVNIVGKLTLAPASRGSLELLAGGAINGLLPVGTSREGLTISSGSLINLSDADPSSIPQTTSPFAYQLLVGRINPITTGNLAIGTDILSGINVLFNESGSNSGSFGVLQIKQALHAPGPLHAGDPNPVRLYAQDGDISGLTLFSGKTSRIIASQDISDIALYIQNVDSEDVSVVSSGRDILAYNANSVLRSEAQASGNALITESLQPKSGDIQISGPGTLEVLAGRNLDLGIGGNNPDGTGVGITSIGNGRNPFLPFEGAAIVAGAGIGPANGLSGSALDFANFITTYLAPTSPQSVRYQTELTSLLQQYGVTTFSDLSLEEQKLAALQIFYLVLRDSGRDRNDDSSPGFGNYDAGFAAIATLFPSAVAPGDILTQGRDIRTRSGGNISLLAPGGMLQLASTTFGNPLSPPGVITESGGNISIFTGLDVDIGIGRIFTLRGGNEIIWSSAGNIAAGSSAVTVQSAPPTRVLVDVQSADVATDLAGLATGGGIGVLATVAGVAPGDVDLIAPTGTVDAGDAGVRSSGNLNIAAVQILNADNIQAAGTSVGIPTVIAPTVNLVGLTAASNTAAASTSAASDVSRQNQEQGTSQQDLPSIITVEVLGYGG